MNQQLKISKELAKQFLTQRIEEGDQLLNRTLKFQEKRRFLMRRSLPEGRIPIFHEPRELQETYQHWIDDILEDCKSIYSKSELYELYFNPPLILGGNLIGSPSFHSEDLTHPIERIKKYLRKLIVMRDQLEAQSPSSDNLVSDNIAQTIEQQLVSLSRRRQKLKEQEAQLGIYTPPHILMEIEDIEKEMEQLQQKRNSSQ